eukprot:3299931-Rhodomonas_salina.1
MNGHGIKRAASSEAEVRCLKLFDCAGTQIDCPADQEGDQADHPEQIEGIGSKPACDDSVEELQQEAQDALERLIISMVPAVNDRYCFEYSTWGSDGEKEKLLDAVRRCLDVGMETDEMSVFIRYAAEGTAAEKHWKDFQCMIQPVLKERGWKEPDIDLEDELSLSLQHSQ